MGSTDEFALPFLASQAGSPAVKVGRVLPHSIPKAWGPLSQEQVLDKV